MRKVTKRYLDCLTNMYTSTQTDGNFSNMKEMTNFYGIASCVGSVLQKQNLLKKNGASRATTYSWIGGVPNETMALGVIDGVNRTSPAFKGTRNLTTRQTNQIEFREGAEKVMAAANLHSLDETITKVREGLKAAKRYGIPAAKEEAFIKEMFFNKK